MIAQRPPAPVRLTNAEFFALPETNRIVELLAGELSEMAPPTIEHQAVSINLIVLLHRIMENGRLLHAPTDVVFEEGYVPQPDIVWIAADNPRCAVDRKRVVGPPDLVIEILSPSTEANERGDKYTLYERHRVREYWLVNPEQQFVEVYVYDETRFVRAGLFTAGENATFESTVLGKMVALASIFA